LKTGAPGSEITSVKLTELLSRDYPGLLSLLRRKLNSRELAADILNDAVVTTLEHARAGRLTDPERIAGYVFKVSMNLARNHHRNMDNRTDLQLPPDTLAALEPHSLGAWEPSSSWARCVPWWRSSAARATARSSSASIWTRRTSRRFAMICG
jgi:DNA-directed RNA polymerase specialized sigma24 family protein